PPPPRPAPPAGRAWFGGASFAIVLDLRRITKPLVHAGREVDSSRGSTRIRGTAPPGAGSRSRGRANGRIPDRFAGRSRVVPARRPPPGSQPPRLSGGVGDGRVPIVALRIEWCPR